MKPLDLLRTAFLNLWRRKLRAFLTVLGMVIGTSSIVVMVSLGIGMRNATIESYEGMGSLTNITVQRWKWVDSGNGMGTSTETVLDDKAVEAFKRIPGVVAVMPQIQTGGLVKSGRYIADISIMAVDAATAELFGIKLSEGEYPTSASSGGTYEIAFSQDVLNWFYNPKTGKQAVNRDGTPIITIDSRFQLTFDYSNVYEWGTQYDENGNPLPPGKMYKLNAVGLVDPDQNDYSWYCLMDIDAIRKLHKENSSFMHLELDNYYQVTVKCEDADAVRSVKAAIDEMGYGTNSLQDWLDQAEEQIQTTQSLLAMIGAVSLIVAAIGIMNTMMMSIYERTKEIGIIKVLGCRMANIAELFLSEAAYIGLFGGALGLGVSYGLSALINGVLATTSSSLGGMRSEIPLYLALGAVLFSIIVALISGLYPALRAMRLSPLAAIRNE